MHALINSPSSINLHVRRAQAHVYKSVDGIIPESKTVVDEPSATETSSEFSNLVMKLLKRTRSTKEKEAKRASMVDKALSKLMTASHNTKRKKNERQRAFDRQQRMKSELCMLDTWAIDILADSHQYNNITTRDVRSNLII